MVDNSRGITAICRWPFQTIQWCYFRRVTNMGYVQGKSCSPRIFIKMFSSLNICIFVSDSCASLVSVDFGTFCFWVLASFCCWILGTFCFWVLGSFCCWSLGTFCLWVLGSFCCWSLGTFCSWILASFCCWILGTFCSWILGSLCCWSLGTLWF